MRKKVKALEHHSDNGSQVAGLRRDFPSVPMLMARGIQGKTTNANRALVGEFEPI